MDMAGCDRARLVALRPDWGILGIGNFGVEQGPVAAQIFQRSMNAISSALDRSIMQMNFDRHLSTIHTKDPARAVQAYLEKRPPTFKGN